MRVLVTGGAGFIGSHTVDLLLREGYAVRVLDALTPPTHLPGVMPAYMPNEVEFIHGDVRDGSAWRDALEDVGAVLHLAAYQDYLTDFSNFFHVNSVGTALLYETLVARNLTVEKVVVASSQATYGEGKYRCDRHGGPSADGAHGESKLIYPALRPEAQLRRGEWEVRCPECWDRLQWVATDEARVNPHNQYGMSKYTQEMIALNLGARYDIPTTCLRYSIVQGERQSLRNAYSGILRSFTQRLFAGNSPVCYEDGAQVRDYVHVGDVARANLLALRDARSNGNVYNVGGEEAITVREYAELLSRKINPQIEPQIPGLYRFGDTRHVVSDISQLKALGWAPTKRVNEIADEYIAWAAAQPDLRDYYAEAEAGMRARGALRAASAP